jgi:two-component system heavy metal sensor histidine kinase CusS
MRFHNRLTLGLLGVTASTLLTSFTTVYFLVQRDELRDLDLALLAQAETVARQSSIEGEARVPEKPASPILRFAAIYGEDGKPQIFTRAFGDRAPPTLQALGVDGRPPDDGQSVELEAVGKNLRGVVIPTARGPLLFAVSRRSVDEDLRYLSRVLAGLFVGALGITALIAQWLGRRLAEDVSAIATTARAVAAGDLSARVAHDAGRGSNETRALANDLDIMVAQLEKLMSAQRTFISHAAHELRSPLATLRGELQLALRRERTADEYRAAVEKALTDAEELAQLTEDLLTLARVQQAPRPTTSTPATVDVRTLVADAARMARGHALAHGVRIDGPSGDALESEISGGRTDLARALRNLIDNAVTHSPEGGVVNVSAHVSDGSVEIVIEDEGPGVDEHDADRIFTPFWRGSTEEGHDLGAGLGLAIAREIARQHGGDIVLDRARARGAAFSLRVPRAPSPVTARQAGVTSDDRSS